MKGHTRLSKFPNASLLLVDTDTEVLEAVVTGEVHAGATYTATPLTWVEAHPDTLHLPSEEPFSSEVTAIAVRKGDLDSLNFFNGWIAVRKANGWLEQRCRYWFEGREWSDQVATDPLSIAECEESFR